MLSICLNNKLLSANKNKRKGNASVSYFFLENFSLDQLQVLGYMVGVTREASFSIFFSILIY